jgi:hypothetical protein
VTINKLRRIGRYTMGNMACFDWTVYTAEEMAERGARDPACAVLRGETKGVWVDLDVDGEFSITIQGCQEHLPTIDMHQSPAKIADKMAMLLRTAS